jgi:hypothetical protein
MTQDERDKILNDPDYISSKRYKYSLKRFLKFHDCPSKTKPWTGAPDSMIASLLKMTVVEVDYYYRSAVSKYQDHLDI